MPAHFCGVFGLKPTEQRVPLTGLIPGLPAPRSVRIMSGIGQMARTVEDLAQLYSIIAGPDGRDTEVQPVPVDEVPHLALKHLRIAFAPTFPGFPVAAEIRNAFDYTGHPAVVLPYKRDRAGLPIGVQLVGKRWNESRLLAMAKALSEVTGAFQRPPGY